MKYYYSIFFFIILISCKSNKNNKTLSFKQKAIKLNSFIFKKNDIDYSNGFGLITKNDSTCLVNLSKTGSLLNFNLISGTFQEFDFLIDSVKKNIDAVNFEGETITIKNKNKILVFENFKLKESFNIPSKGNEFTIHHMYSNSLLRNGRNFYYQYGIASNFNRIDSTAILNFDNSSSRKIIKYPEIFKKIYFQYNDICISNINDTFYSIFSLFPNLSKYSSNGVLIMSKQLDTSGYLKYDTTKLTDMKYLYDYTMNTKQNIKILTTNKSIVIIERVPINNKTADFYMSVYDTNLLLKSKNKIEHNIDPNFIFLINGKLHFISIKEKMIYSYENFD